MCYAFVAMISASRILYPLIFISLLQVILVAAASEPKNQRETSSPAPSDVDVFYSTPPFAHEVQGEVEVKIKSYWSRQEVEDEVREHVARKAATIGIITQKKINLADEVRIVYTPSPGSGVATPHLDIPPNEIHLVVQLASRSETGESKNQEVYEERFETVWKGVLHALDSMGLKVDLVDHESRYLMTVPVAASQATISCQDPEASWQIGVFDVYVSSYKEQTTVRFDSQFKTPESFADSGCESKGFYEGTFFRHLRSALESPEESSGPLSLGGEG